MKKVLHLRSSFDPGGTEMLLMNLFNYPQEYFSIHLVLIKRGSLINYLRPQNGNRFYEWYRERSFDQAVFRKLLGLVRDEGIDIVHTHQFIELFYAVCLKVLNPRLKLIHQIHLMFARRTLIFYIERFLSQKFAKVITVSYAAKKELVESFGFRKSKISILYNAVDLRETQSASPGEVKHLPVPVQKGKINVVMVANFVWGKDHETILKAYDSFIRERLPSLNLYFIGAESEISERLIKQYLTDEDLQERRVVFTGSLPNARNFLPLFDIVLMSSHSETFSIAIVEAAAMGKVVLTSDIPVFLELSENGKYFHHFKTGNAFDLYQSLCYLVTNLTEVSRMDHSPYFRAKFGFDQFLRSLNEIYSN